MRTGQSLRCLFAIILEQCEPSQPDQLWLEFCEHLCDDLRWRLQQRGIEDVSADDIYDFGLFLLERILLNHGKSLSLFPSMPLPQKDWGICEENPYLTEQLRYLRQHERELADTQIPQLNAEQRHAFEEIFQSVSDQAGKTFFVHGPGRTGKTFLYKTLCHRVRSEGWIALCVASSGIAALLLPGGRTSHSTFQIPIDPLSHDSMCNIDFRSLRAEMLRHVWLIIWDEAVMQHW
ncbi:PIF1-like helicase-domain-containing protein [Cytidiella melzeri]|nr:PIF1-like helicase-domain-containing protein [Cytidiella melzeri]